MQIWYEIRKGKFDQKFYAERLKKLINDIGSNKLSSLTFKFLSFFENGNDRFPNDQYFTSPEKSTLVTYLCRVPKRSACEITNQYIVIGTESGEVLFLDDR